MPTEAAKLRKLFDKPGIIRVAGAPTATPPQGIVLVRRHLQRGDHGTAAGVRVYVAFNVARYTLNVRGL